MKRVLTLLGVALVIFLILTNPNGASGSVQNIGNILYNAAQSVSIFFTNLFWPVLAPREIDEYLLPTERRVIRVRQHWAVMAKHISQTLLFLVAMVVLESVLDGRTSPDVDVVIDNLAFYLSLVAVLRFTANTILWWIERIVITDKRVMIAQGIIVHNVGMMPLGKVTDLTFRRTLSGRMLGYGTMVVESAGQIQALNQIDFMPRPEEIYEALSELVFGEKGKTRATGMLAKPRWRR